jgi:hypothetical protein
VVPVAGRKRGDTAYAMLYSALAGRFPAGWQPDPDVVTAIFNIEHGLDIWHKAKSVSAKVVKCALKKEFRDLGPWASAVRNHLWWCAQNCGGDAVKLKVG